MKNNEKGSGSKTINRTTPVPESLGGLIEFVNMLPFEMKLPRVLDTYLDYELITHEDIYSINTQGLREILIETLETLPKSFLDYIWDGAIPEVAVDEELEILNSDISCLKENTEQAALRYLYFRDFRNQIRRLIKITEKVLYFGKEKLHGEHKDSLISEYIQDDINQLQLYPKFEINEKNEIRLSLNDFSQAIYGIDITRIKSCKKCKKIFWAGRKDQSCCSHICKNQFHSKNKMSEKSQTRKRMRRIDAVKKLKEKYKDSLQYTEDATIHICDAEGKLLKSKKLPKETELKILDVSFSNEIESMPIRFFVEIQKNEKGFISEKGYIDVEFNVRYRSNLKRTFWLSDS